LDDPTVDYAAAALKAKVCWYLARLEAPNLTLAGGTLPGAPVVILGHTTRLPAAMRRPMQTSRMCLLKSSIPPTRRAT
jgi:hypothetical protein